MNSAKTIAQQVAKQMVQEPMEILGGVGRQVVGMEQPGRSNEDPQPESNSQPQTENQTQLQQQDKIASARKIQDLDEEIRGIERQRVFNDLQRKIQEGQEVYLNDITELSYEQKDVLKAQMETIKAQKNQMQASQAVQEPVSKPSRRFAFGKGAKSQALREQTKTERPLPPSG